MARAEATCALGNEIAWMLPSFRIQRLNTLLFVLSEPVRSGPRDRGGSAGTSGVIA